MRYFLEFGVISDRQYGFLPGRSTQEAIFDLFRHVYSAINNKKVMGLLFLDISKAFDCIIHKRLLKKLEVVGCDRDVIRWFEIYLTRLRLYCIMESSLPLVQSLQGSVRVPYWVL